jgi:hypothetical protein
MYFQIHFFCEFAVIERWIKTIIICIVTIDLSVSEPSSFFDSFLNPAILPSTEKAEEYDKTYEPNLSTSSPFAADSGNLEESLRQISLAQTQPFIQRRLFNTSVALTVPLFSFTLPQRATQGTSVDLANQVGNFYRTFKFISPFQIVIVRLNSMFYFAGYLRAICSFGDNPGVHCPSFIHRSETFNYYRT